MDDKTIISLVGIISTLISSSLGLFFTAKQKSSSLRLALYNKQLDLITKITYKLGRFRVFATILATQNDDFLKRARDDIGLCMQDFSELEEEGAAILPVEFWSEIKQLSNHMANILIEFDEESCISEDHLREFVARYTKIALLARSIIGAEELTEESLKLFSSKKRYEVLANKEIDDFKSMYDQANN